MINDYLINAKKKIQTSNLKCNDQWIQKNLWKQLLFIKSVHTLWGHPASPPHTHWTLDMVWWQHNNNDYLV